MPHLPRIAVAALLLAIVSTLARAEPAPAELRRQVEDTERAFAQTMADRDYGAFAAFLSEEAIFFGGGEPLRGKQQVAAAWKGYFEKADAPFSWAPEVVEVLPSGALAHSSGPVFNPAGERIATFNSVWRLDADGRWRIVFDKGSRDCPPRGPAEEQ